MMKKIFYTCLLLWFRLPRLFICTILFPLAVFGTEHNLPNLGNSAKNYFNNQTEETLAFSFLETLHQYTDINPDPELNDYIRDIGQRLLRHVRTTRQFQFYLINDPAINAFAGPGGIIGVNTGLLISAKTEDEIAAVLAHEIQHVEQEHLARMFEQQQKGLLPTIAGILGALLVGSQNPQAGMAIMTSSIAYQMEQQLSFSRDHEWEADRLGIDILAEAGYDPNAMANFFETLADRYRTGSKGSELLQTHPVTDKRISDSRAKAQHIIKKTQKHNNMNIAIAQARLEGLSLRPSNQTDPSLICYQKHLTEWLKQAPKSSCSSMPNHHWTEMLNLQINTTSHQEITKRWQKLLQLYPQKLSVWLRYADHLLEAHNYNQLISDILPQTELHTGTFPLWTILAKAYYALDDEASSAWALSKAYASRGQFKLSKTQLQRAQHLQNTSTNPLLNFWLEKHANWLEEKEKERNLLE